MDSGISRLASALLLAAAGMLSSAAAQADIYGFVDEDGTVNLANHPTIDRYELWERSPKAPVAKDAAAARLAPGELAGSYDRFRPLVDEAARAAEVDAALVHAVIAVESRYNPKAVSKKGASGLMQLMPDTARRYGVADVFDPAQNIRAGARYLGDLLKQFNKDVKLALAAYNAGEHVVARYGNKIPPYRETAAYVPKVLAYYKKLGATVQDG
jgi:soluble lytic murein transglycosylase-like protein